MLKVGGKMFDSRGVVARIDELEGERDNHPVEDPDALDPAAEWAMEYPEDAEELEKLVAFREEVRSREFGHGLTFIRDDYFEQYAEEYASDVGALKDSAQWPYCHIDWKAAAEALQQDYTSVELDGDTYWYLYV